MFRPVSSSKLQQFIGWINGQPAEYIDAKRPALPSGRSVNTRSRLAPSSIPRQHPRLALVVRFLVAVSGNSSAIGGVLLPRERAALCLDW